jgi:hypothetical protein
LNYRLLCVGLALVLGVAGPVLGAEPAAKAADPAVKPAKPKADKQDLVCTTQEVAGSLIPKRVCQTRKQIDAQRQAVEDLSSERREQGGTKTELLGMTPSGTLNGH